VIFRAAAHDGGQLEALLDRDNLASGVWADTAYRSQANLALLNRRGLVAQFQRAKPRGKPMPAHIRRGNATRAKVRARVEHVFAAQKRRLGLIVRTIGIARATTRITLANLAYNMRRLVCDGGPADEAVRPVDADVVLVAEHRHDDLRRRLPSQAARRRTACAFGRASASSDRRGRSAGCAPASSSRARRRP
jgi:hypothetical protein